MSDRRERRRGRRSDLIELRFLEGVFRRRPRDELVLKAMGDLYTRVGRYQDGLTVDLSLADLCPDDAVVWYNLACSYARLAKTDDALDALRRAVSLGYDDAGWMRRDEDLRSLAGDSRFRAILESIGPRGARRDP
jgi:tetratricopeptide (TPR) repeat protein